MNKYGAEIMKSILITALCLLAFSVHAELFKWKDADGNLIYSDQPPPGKDKAESEVAEEELPQIIAVPAPKASSGTRSSSPTRPPKVTKVKELTIVEPIHDTAVRQNSGNVKISVRVLPDNFSETGSILVIYMDGQEISKGSQTSIQLMNIDRGTHTVKAELLNPSGHVIKVTRPTVFHLLRFHN